jgi:hypothetical protein
VGLQLNELCWVICNWLLVDVQTKKKLVDFVLLSLSGTSYIKDLRQYTLSCKCWFTQFHGLHWMLHICFFLRFTQYNAHSPLWIHVRKPYSYEHLRRTENRQITLMNTRTQDLEILEVTTIGTSSSMGTTYARCGDSWSHHHWRLVVDGNVAYHLTHNTEKSWNKTRKRC